jgi:hypothetical protein
MVSVNPNAARAGETNSLGPALLQTTPKPVVIRALPSQSAARRLLQPALRARKELQRKSIAMKTHQRLDAAKNQKSAAWR